MWQTPRVQPHLWIFDWLVFSQPFLLWSGFFLNQKYRKGCVKMKIMKSMIDMKYVVLAVVVVSAALGFGGYKYHLMMIEVGENTERLEREVFKITEQNILLADTLQKEQQKNSMFQSQIGQIAGTVGTLDKLAKTDKELLQKYSKVYFLNEHYMPDELAEIDSKYIYEKDKKIQIHAKVLPNLSNLLEAAKDDGIDLKIISGYRSFGEQSALKSSYSVTYGSGANKFSADQGYSEHQLGTALDFTAVSLGAGFTDFKKTAEFKWLQDNAYKYGFILSYPEGNTYYQFEPWHWRFVGKNLAKTLREDGKTFYNVGQPFIDQYLISIFD